MRFLLRPVLAVGSLVGLIGCVGWAGELARQTPVPPAVADADRAVRDTFRGDPVAETALRAAATPTALAVFVKSLGPDGRDARLTQAAAAVRRGLPVAELTLAQAALAAAPDDRGRLLTAHGEAADGLAVVEAAQAAYLRSLTEALADPEARSDVIDDPLGLVVRTVADPELRQFYRTHRDWLAEPLAQLEPADDEPADRVFGDALRAARAYFPLTEQAVARHDLGSLGLALFVRHGRLIQRAVDRHKLPLGEVIEALFANQEELANDPPERAADRLGAARDQGPEVWQAVRATPLALRLLADAGVDGAEVLRRYAADDVAGLLYVQFPDHVPAAAGVIARFGDRGLLALRMYGGPDSQVRERFRRLLAAHGWRVVPYLSVRGIAGLDELEANPRAYDKYFDPAGRPRDKEWWAAVPIVGAPADLARNLALGYPVELEEVGWAALDVGDAVMIAATLGAATPVVAAKQTAKVGVKQGVKRAARQEAVRVGAGALARRVVAAPVRLVVRGGRLVATAAGTSLRGVTRAVEAVGRLSPAQKKWVVRGLLGAVAFAAFARLSAADLERVRKYVVGRAEELAKRAATLIGEQLLDGLEAVLGPLPTGWRRFAGPAAGGLVCLGGVTWGCWPRVRPRRRYGA